MAEEGGPGTLVALGAHADHSWMRELTRDPDSAKHEPNNTCREVFSGHWVPVRPKPLPNPYLVIHSASMAAELGLSEEECGSQRFCRFFSGRTDAVPAFHDAGSWATPYALSIYGQPRDPSPDTFGTGNGYGDGRAISIAEVLLPGGRRWELQIKGAGGTPFRRTGDGRAVLRSSLREFLASEAMHAMGVETTRALSLVASRSESATRAWYSPGATTAHQDPRMAMMMQMFGGGGGKDPDMQHSEACAMTCRTARSFLRVGHFELYQRRAARRKQDGLEHLKQLAEHALRREYADVDPGAAAPLQRRVLAMARAFSARIAALAADWLRVGYVQSNFNSDNCLVGGRTMDYGPFGFVEKYDPGWGMWVGSGDHFAFMNQPRAAHMNFITFCRSLVPLLDEAGKAELQEIATGHEAVSDAACNDVWRRKLGLTEWSGGCAELWEQLESLLRQSGVDWTIFWRQLAASAECAPDAAPEELLRPLEPAFYAGLPGPEEVGKGWRAWLPQWRARVGGGGAAAAALMRRTSPKYVPREWMLVEGYAALGFDGKKDDRAPARDLLTVLTTPFDEHPDFEQRWYRKQQASASQQGGTGYMT